MASMKASPVPVRMTAWLPRSKAMSSRRRGNWEWVVPVKVTGPPPVWKRTVRTPDGVRVSAKFS